MACTAIMTPCHQHVKLRVKLKHPELYNEENETRETQKYQYFACAYETSHIYLFFLVNAFEKFSNLRFFITKSTKITTTFEPRAATERAFWEEFPTCRATEPLHTFSMGLGTANSGGSGLRYGLR